MFPLPFLALVLQLFMIRPTSIPLVGPQHHVVIRPFFFSFFFLPLNISGSDFYLALLVFAWETLESGGQRRQYGNGACMCNSSLHETKDSISSNSLEAFSP
jgi:hypothetical protein